MSTLLKVGTAVKYRRLGEPSYRESTIAHIGEGTGAITLQTGEIVRAENLIPIDAVTRQPL